MAQLAWVPVFHIMYVGFSIGGRRLEPRAVQLDVAVILIGDRVIVNKLAYDLRIPFTFTRIGQTPSAQTSLPLNHPKTAA